MESERHWQRYFEEGQRWMTPEEVALLRKTLGSADDMLERHEAIEQLLREAENRRIVWAFMRSAALAFATAIGILATIKAVLPPGWGPW